MLRVVMCALAIRPQAALSRRYTFVGWPRRWYLGAPRRGSGQDLLLPPSVRATYLPLIVSLTTVDPPHSVVVR